MRTLTAAEAISPAIDRTKALLFQPFRKGRTWKLAMTAYLCRIGTIFFPFPLFYLAFIPVVRSKGTLALTGLIAAVVLFTLLLVVLFHLGSRLQFAFFDILVHRGALIAPAWRKYRRQALAWSGLKIVLGTAVMLAAALPILAYVHHVLPLLQAMSTVKPGQPPPPEFFGAIFAGYGILFLIFGPFFLVSSLLSDFVVPMLALEDTGAAEAFRRLFALIRREPSQFALYTLLKIALGIAVYIGATLAWEVVFIVGTIILFLVAGGIGFLLHLAGVPSVLLMGVAIFLGVVWYILCAGYALFLTLGSTMTFLDAYALYFLGGRYPLLGELLDRTEPLPSDYIPPPGQPYPYSPPPCSDEGSTPPSSCFAPSP